MAALVFIFVMDALHIGLRNNPFGSATPGYTLLRGPTINSLGYSDDTVTVANSWESACIQHEWVREFLVAHHMRLNPLKSYCIIGSGTGTSAGLEPDPSLKWLPGIHEAQVHDPLHRAPCTVTGALPNPGACDIYTHGPSKSFRYLGYQIHVDLEDGEVIREVALKLREACSIIRTHALNLVHAADVLREYLYPRIELGLLFASIPIARLRRWESIIRTSVLHRSHDAATRALASTALHAALGILPLTAHTRQLKATELGVMLRAGACWHCDHGVQADHGPCRRQIAHWGKICVWQDAPSCAQGGDAQLTSPLSCDKCTPLRPRK